LVVTDPRIFGFGFQHVALYEAALALSAGPIVAGATTADVASTAVKAITRIR
jgi:hypothetical protein